MEITKTEALVKINKIKLDHENKKKEILEMLELLSIKEKELDDLEKEYMKYIDVLIEREV